MIRDFWEWVKHVIVGDGIGEHAKPYVKRARRAERDDCWDDYDDYEDPFHDEDGLPIERPNPFYDDTFSKTHPDGWPAIREARDNDIPFYDEFRLRLADYLGIFNMSGAGYALAA